MTHGELTFGRYLDYLVYGLVVGVEHLLAVIPERWSYAAGRFLGRLGYVMVPDRRDAAVENLTIAFGKERSPEWIRSTARKSFEHMGMMVVEFFLLRRWSQKEMAERITISGSEHFNLVTMPGNEGFCLLVSHFGSFEVAAAVVKHLGFRLNVIVTGLKNPFVTRYLFSRGGKDSGVTVFPHKGIVKEMIARLLRGEAVAFLADQRGDAERGIFVDYFGTPAPANGVFAKIAIEGEARVQPLACWRTAEGRFNAEMGKEIHIRCTGDELTDLTTVSQQFHAQFEAWLRMCPEQGFWFQRKWRRAPSRRRKKRRQNVSSSQTNGFPKGKIGGGNSFAKGWSPGPPSENS